MRKRPHVRIELPDINVLLALLDPMHPHHDSANNWYVGAAFSGWTICPLTENGFVRILSSPSCPGVRLRLKDAIALLETTVANSAATHHFWHDSVSLRDKTLFLPSGIADPKQITDVYLLSLCQQNGGTLVTLDSGVTTAALLSPHPQLLRTL